MNTGANMDKVFPIPEFNKLAQKLVDNGYSVRIGFAKGNDNLVIVKVAEDGVEVAAMYDLRQLELIRFNSSSWADLEYKKITEQF